MPGLKQGMLTMTNMLYSEIFPLGPDTTEYKKITSDHVSKEQQSGRSIIRIEPEALTQLAEHAFRDISHLLRPSHLAQLRSILEDKEASKNLSLIHI